MQLKCYLCGGKQKKNTQIVLDLADKSQRELGWELYGDRRRLSPKSVVTVDFLS